MATATGKGKPNPSSVSRQPRGCSGKAARRGGGGGRQSPSPKPFLLFSPFSFFLHFSPFFSPFSPPYLLLRPRSPLRWREDAPAGMWQENSSRVPALTPQPPPHTLSAGRVHCKKGGSKREGGGRATATSDAGLGGGLSLLRFFAKARGGRRCSDTPREIPRERGSRAPRGWRGKGGGRNGVRGAANPPSPTHAHNLSHVLLRGDGGGGMDGGGISISSDQILSAWTGPREALPS